MNYQKKQITAVNVEKKEKDGKTYFRCGLMIEDVWHNANLWSEGMQTFRLIEKGQRFYVNLYEKEYEGQSYKQFTLPTLGELLYLAILDLNADMATLLAMVGADTDQVATEKIQGPEEQLPPPGEKDLPF